jgi:hypothetical protein
MRFLGEGANDPHTRIERGIGGVYDAERRLAVCDHQQGGTHILRDDDAASHSGPDAERF